VRVWLSLILYGIFVITRYVDVLKSTFAVPSVKLRDSKSKNEITIRKKSDGKCMRFNRNHTHPRINAITNASCLFVHFCALDPENSFALALEQEEFEVK